MAHSCDPGCAHWCQASPTKRHRWVLDPTGSPSAPGHCRDCDKRRKFGGGVGRHMPDAESMKAADAERMLTRGTYV